jgi:hypothetical protein
MVTDESGRAGMDALWVRQQAPGPGDGGHHCCCCSTGTGRLPLTQT